MGDAMMKYVRFASEERGRETLKKLICGFLCDEREKQVWQNIHFFSDSKRIWTKLMDDARDFAWFFTKYILEKYQCVINNYLFYFIALKIITYFRLVYWVLTSKQGFLPWFSFIPV